MTAQCLACKIGVSVEEYCRKSRGVSGCPRGIKKVFNKDVMEEADESGMDEFSTFGDEDVTDEAVGGIISAGRKFLPHSTPVENGAKIFMQGRSGSELNKAVNHGAKKQWSWAPSSRPNPKTDWGARSSRAIKKFFNKDVMEEADESGMDEF
eukprot:g1541.t1